MWSRTFHHAYNHVGHFCLSLIYELSRFTIPPGDRGWGYREGSGRRSVPRRAWIALLSFWPGLAQIWSGQEVLGLILAILFTASLNLAIVARFIWTEAFAPGWPAFLTAFAFLIWFASFFYTLWWVWLCHPERHRQEIERLFR